MKKYVLNKNFIPSSFVEKNEKILYQKNNKLILLLIILNVFIIPHTISKISDEINKNKAIPAISYNNKKIDNNKENIISLLKCTNNIKNMKIQNNSGYIELESAEELYKIEEESILKIKSVVIKEKFIEVSIEL